MSLQPSTSHNRVQAEILGLKSKSKLKTMLDQNNCLCVTSVTIDIKLLGRLFVPHSKNIHVEIGESMLLDVWLIIVQNDRQ